MHIVLFLMIYRWSVPQEAYRELRSFKLTGRLWGELWDGTPPNLPDFCSQNVSDFETDDELSWISGRGVVTGVKSRPNYQDRERHRPIATEQIRRKTGWRV